jgi:hypothetical protein
MLSASAALKSITRKGKTAIMNNINTVTLEDFKVNPQILSVLDTGKSIFVKKP